ncbi:MAG TPA: Gfo/Idh/MocA family oxidoreductase [Plantibacter sp.]|uniref:Gfo/Idh/MocA family protein n=1 Tax=unclassified Plantibacter TaxID=2624265 RepID=UPI002BBD5C2D|nr:Gfo/Idh/MocA family oxidoreductase [Plantibacter sp.]
MSDERPATSETTVRRVAVIGCGDISALHLSAIATVPDARLVAVCDIDDGRLAATSGAAGVPGFADLDRLLDEIRPDVVHICTPHHLHADQAIRALDRGISVILEKPLAHSREEADRLIAAAARSDAKIAVCFQNRYNRPVERAKELLDSGELGAVLGASAVVPWHRTAAYYEDRPWRGRWETGGGGLLMNQAIHTIDLVQWLVGEALETSGSISTRALADVIEVEDTAELRIVHAGGATSTVYATVAGVANLPITVDIVCEAGTLSLAGDLTTRHADGRVEVTTERTTASGERAYWGVSHELLIRDFYAGLDEPGGFWIDPTEARKAFEIIQDVYDESAPERRVAASAGATTG